MKILEVNDLKKSYLGFNLDVSFFINKGESVGLIGQNGAGKTTILNLILNLVKKDSGNIRIFGQDNINNEDMIKKNMGIVLEDSNFYKEYKMNSILKFVSEIYPEWDWDYARYLIEKFELTQNKKFKSFSKGMKQKLFFIIAVCHKAKILIFDELTSGLDPYTRRIVIDELIAIKEKGETSILFSSHILSDIEELSDRVMFINRGEIILNEEKKVINKWQKLEIERCSKMEEIKGSEVILSQIIGEKEMILITEEEFNIEKYIDKENIKNLKTQKINMEDIFLTFLKAHRDTDRKF